VEVWGSSPHEPTIPTFSGSHEPSFLFLQSLNSRPFILVQANISIVVSKNVAGDILRHAGCRPSQSFDIEEFITLAAARSLTVPDQFNSLRIRRTWNSLQPR
jgi:hypothetical protein